MVLRRPRFIALVLIGSQLACYGPMREYHPLTDFPERQPAEVRITFNDGHTTRISSPRVLNDTALAGWDIAAQHAVEYPLSSIKSVVGHERSAARTSILGIAILTGIIVGSIVASSGTSGESVQNPF